MSLNCLSQFRGQLQGLVVSISAVFCGCVVTLGCVLMVLRGSEMCFWKPLFKAGARPLELVSGGTLDLPPNLRQMVKTHFSLNGELSHGVVT